MPGRQMRQSSAEVDQFVSLSMMLIEAAGSYAEGGLYDPDADGMMRRLRVITNALQSALNNIMITPATPVPSPTPIPPVEPGHPEIEPAVAAPAGTPAPPPRAAR